MINKKDHILAITDGVMKIYSLKLEISNEEVA